VDAAQQAGTEDNNYPPCNVERLGEDRYQISLAVAGFSADEIAITSMRVKSRPLLITKSSIELGFF
jgi:HSP20 family molecular chaperone IbpA